MAESGLVAFAVVENLDVVEDDRAHLRAGLALDRSVKELNFSLGRGPECFHRGVDAPISQECR